MLWLNGFMAAVCFGASSVAFAAPPEMTSIESFVEQNVNSTNGATEVFVGLRCASLMRLMAIHTQENGMAKEASSYADASETFFGFAKKSQNPHNDEYLVSQIKLMFAAYKDRFLTAKARTGNFSDDPIIKQDMLFCSDMMSS